MISTRPYQERDFEDCDWLQKSFYLRPASQEELRSRLRNPSWVAIIGWPDNFEEYVVGNVITSNVEPLVWSLVVSPKFRRLGVGDKLMAAAETFYKGKTMRLFVEPRNAAAHKLYLSRNWKAAQLIKDYYGKGYDAVEMYKEC